MLIHQFITFGFACTPLYFVWEKFIGMHNTKSLYRRALAGLPVVIPIWFLVIIFPFFRPINSTVGSLLVSFTVMPFTARDLEEKRHHIKTAFQLIMTLILQYRRDLVFILTSLDD